MTRQTFQPNAEATAVYWLTINQIRELYDYRSTRKARAKLQELLSSCKIQSIPHLMMLADHDAQIRPHERRQSLKDLVALARAN